MEHSLSKYIIAMECRRLHIYHWPARQIMSLQKTVDGLVNSIASGSSDVDLARLVIASPIFISCMTF